MDDAKPFDLLVIGGGINGAGIARDAAGRGLGVLLVEQDDLASGTSSASSKLVHGGLRYLELYEFRLVREALAEREVLLSIAPHIVWPLRFVLPHDAGLRPAWMIRAGLLLYDHLAARLRLPASQALDLRRDGAGAPLKERFARGFAYSDCWVDDSRLVVLNALDAAERGARIRTRCRFVSASPASDAWTITLESAGKRIDIVRARVIVNAAGPWVDQVLRQGFRQDAPRKLRLVKGSHIVVPRVHAGEHAYILQNPDRRIVFALPFERHFTLIGTTDEFFDADPGPVTVTGAETAYLCDAASRFLKQPVRPEQVVWSYAGIRPLYDDAAADPSTMTRDYAFDLAVRQDRPPVLSIFGGKLTTYRRLAEHALAKLQPFIPGAGGAWTSNAPLPGGDIARGDFEGFRAELMKERPWLPSDLAYRLARAYGTRVNRLLGSATRLSDLGRDLGAGLTEREAEYLVREEWARASHDILWRRSKIGLHGGTATTQLSDYLNSVGAAVGSP